MFAELRELIPLGGGVVLFALLLRTMISERDKWNVERQEMKTQHRIELDRRDSRISHLERQLDAERES